VITLAEWHDKICHLKNLLDQAQHKVEKTSTRLNVAKNAKKKISQSSIKEGRLKMGHNRRHRKQQPKVIEQIQNINTANKVAQLAVDEAEFQYNLAKSEFDNIKLEFSTYIMRITDLLDYFYDNYSVKTEINSSLINISFGGKGGPFGLSHGHYILDLKTFYLLCYRKVDEPHCFNPPIALVYEPSQN